MIPVLSTPPRDLGKDGECPVEHLPAPTVQRLRLRLVGLVVGPALACWRSVGQR
jgi:hypothetical protein